MCLIYKLHINLTYEDLSGFKSILNILLLIILVFNFELMCSWYFFYSLLLFSDYFVIGSDDIYFIFYSISVFFYDFILYFL